MTTSTMLGGYAHLSELHREIQGPSIECDQFRRELKRQAGAREEGFQMHRAARHQMCHWRRRNTTVFFPSSHIRFQQIFDQPEAGGHQHASMRKIPRNELKSLLGNLRCRTDIHD